MPIKFFDNHICEKCGRAFKWNYYEQVRNKFDSPPYKVEAIPVEKTLAYSCKHGIDDTYNIKVNCPYCDYDNQFTFYLNKRPCEE